MRSSEELSGCRSSCQKLLVLKQLNLQVVAKVEPVQNNCKIVREYGYDSVNLQFVAIRQVGEVASEQIKKVKRVNLRCHWNETRCAVICRVSWIQSNSPDVVSFRREVVVFGLNKNVTSSRILSGSCYNVYRARGNVHFWLASFLCRHNKPKQRSISSSIEESR